MKKFILSLLIPFMMVMASFAGEMTFAEDSNYEYDDFSVELVQTDEEGFQFTVNNGTGDTVYFDFDETAIYDYIPGTTEIDLESKELIFSDDDVAEDYDVIEDGESLESPEYYLGENEMICLALFFEIDGEQYYWMIAIANVAEE